MELGGRTWTCVLSAADATRSLEQWCPGNELPSRATVLLSRALWSGSLGAAPEQYLELSAEALAETSLVRPTLTTIYADHRAAAALLVFEGDVLMGESWMVKLAVQGQDEAAVYTAEYPGPVGDPDAAMGLLAGLTAVPQGVVSPADGSTTDAAVGALAGLSLQVGETTLEQDLAEVSRVIEACEALPPAMESNQQLAELATKLVAAAGAGFFGFTAESLRLFRVLLRRTNRPADPTDWALYARGALLSLAELTPPSHLDILVAASETATAKQVADSGSPARQLECAVLQHGTATLLLRAAVRAGPEQARALYERALAAARASENAARQLGDGFGSFVYAALLVRADAHRALGTTTDERASLQEARSLASESGGRAIDARLRELDSAQSAAEQTGGDAAAVAEHIAAVAASARQNADRVVHSSPLRRRATDGSVLVLRPLVTALTPAVPNRFTDLFRHNFRFEAEPPALTFEETLSRALGHRFAFTAVGAEFEAYGLGRLETTASVDPQDHSGWKRVVTVCVQDRLLSPIVLVYPSDSPGMNWELDLLANSDCRGQARVFLVPPHTDLDAGRAAWERARQALVTRRLSIPAWNPDGLVFRHDPHGGVVEHSTFEAVWDGRFARRLEALVVDPTQ